MSLIITDKEPKTLGIVKIESSENLYIKDTKDGRLYSVVEDKKENANRYVESDILIA